MKRIHVFLTVAFSLIFILSGYSNTRVKVALLLDTSNSMDGLIDQAKSQLWKVVNELSHCRYASMQPNLEIALYEYGNDNLPMREGYIRQVTTFTSDLDLISEKLFGLRTNGGSEFCGQVISESLQQLNWAEGKHDLKMIFIAGNEPFNQGNVSYREVCKTARQNDIIVNTIFCGNFQEGIETFWKDGAYIGGGDYMNIDQDCRYVDIHTPYDDRIHVLNKQLNNTYIEYGTKGKEKKVRQEEQDRNAASMSGESAIQRTLSKGSGSYQNDDWDLVDAFSANDKIITEIDENELPPEMKGMTGDEKVKYIVQKQEERSKIIIELNELDRKRSQFIAEQNKEQSNKLLEQAIVAAVKKQALARNYIFE